ncbi:MAG: hypothetical protein SFV21_06250 [Rhodospirillaceae bacterium]|nr:hypothetical protein [Rhodospirillaceae bacterium]
MPDAAAFRRALPVMSRSEGVWEGTYRRFSGDGQPMGVHRSRVVFRLLENAAGGEIYHQTNIYRFADGRTQVIDSTGTFDGEKLVFNSDRGIAGWAKDDASDPHGRVCLLFMEATKDTPQLKVGTVCYELVQISDCGRFRMRMAQYVLDGKVLMRTLIDETFVTRDWAREADWSKLPLDGQ